MDGCIGGLSIANGSGFRADVLCAAEKEGTMVTRLAAILVMVAAACGSDNEAAVREEQTFFLQDPVVVERVVDGDTIAIDRRGRDYRVRFKGIQAPELFTVPVEPLAAEAQNFVLDRAGFRVDLVFETSCGDRPYETCFDGNGRLLAYVINERGEDLGEGLLAVGLARVFRFQGESFDRLDAYNAAETAAKSQRLGLWRESQ